MSYILDALRKSESERQQGRVPDFNQQVRMIHQPRRKRVPAVVWLALALVFNAVVIAVVFWPAQPEPTTVPNPAPAVGTNAIVEDSVAAFANELINERPTVIVPSARTKPAARKEHAQADSHERVPHLVELSSLFQRSVPDLIFSSHVYASDPLARRVMINDHYLRAGDAFSGIRVDRITEEGVELSKNGKRFRVGVVRDWITPR